MTLDDVRPRQIRVKLDDLNGGIVKDEFFLIVYQSEVINEDATD